MGQNLEELKDSDLREFRTNFGMSFQYSALFDSMTNFENVAFPMREFTKMTNDEIIDKVNWLAGEVGLDDVAMKKLPSEISGGMRKRVGLARALALKPKVMLYDEPTTGLDPITTHMVDDLIRTTHNKNQDVNMTTVIISHDIQATLRISDYIAFLEKGAVVEHSAVEDFKKSENPIIRKFLDLSSMPS